MSVKIANIQGKMVLVLYCWSSEIICGPKQIDNGELKLGVVQFAECVPSMKLWVQPPAP